MSQTRVGSFIEATVNVAIGFGINFTANMIILPAYGFSQLDAATNFKIGILYTVISVIRSYVIRRWFNKKLHIFSEKVAHTVDTVVVMR